MLRGKQLFCFSLGCFLVVTCQYLAFFVHVEVLQHACPEGILQKGRKSDWKSTYARQDLLIAELQAHYNVAQRVALKQQKKIVQPGQDGHHFLVEVEPAAVCRSDALLLALVDGNNHCPVICYLGWLSRCIFCPQDLIFWVVCLRLILWLQQEGSLHLSNYDIALHSNKCEFHKRWFCFFITVSIHSVQWSYTFPWVHVEHFYTPSSLFSFFQHCLQPMYHQFYVDIISVFYFYFIILVHSIVGI